MKNMKQRGGTIMGKIDICTKEYVSNPRIFADAFNYYFFQGKQVVKSEELTMQDIAEISLPYGENSEEIFVPIHSIFKPERSTKETDRRT